MPIKYAILSDTHFAHKHMLDFERARGARFSSIEQHDEFMCRLWEDTAKKLGRQKTDTDFYFLGDLGRPSQEIHEHLIEVRASNPSVRFVWILGNHDSQETVSEYKDIFDEVEDNPVWISHRVLLSHRPQIVWPGQVNVHGHTHAATLNDPRFLCASVAQANFMPITDKYVASVLGKMDPPDYRFLWEPWADMYKFDKYKTDVVKDKCGNIDLAASRVLQYIQRQERNYNE